MSHFDRKSPETVPNTKHSGWFLIHYLCTKHSKIMQLTTWVDWLIIIGQTFYFRMKLAAQDTNTHRKVVFGPHSLLWSHTTVILPHWNACKIAKVQIHFCTLNFVYLHKGLIVSFCKCHTLSSGMQKSRSSPRRFFAIGPGMKLLPDFRDSLFGRRNPDHMTALSQWSQPSAEM